jgi:hypothetical protein
VKRTFFSCERCTQECQGGYDPQRGVILCQQHMQNSSALIESTMIHELIHAFDDCRAHVKWDDMTHHACTEIRAANLSGDCSFSQELARGNFKLRAQQQKCVRRRAELSVAMNPSSTGPCARTRARAHAREPVYVRPLCRAREPLYRAREPLHARAHLCARVRACVREREPAAPLPGPNPKAHWKPLPASARDRLLPRCRLWVPAFACHAIGACACHGRHLWVWPLLAWSQAQRTSRRPWPEHGPCATTIAHLSPITGLQRKRQPSPKQRPHSDGSPEAETESATCYRLQGLEPCAFGGLSALGGRGGAGQLKLAGSCHCPLGVTAHVVVNFNLAGGPETGARRGSRSRRGGAESWINKSDLACAGRQRSEVRGLQVQSVQTLSLTLRACLSVSLSVSA